MQPSDAEQVLRMRLASCTTTVHDITMARRHAAAVSRGDGLHPNIHYSTYKGAAFSQFDYMQQPGQRAVKARFSATIPQKAQSTMNTSSKRRSAQDFVRQHYAEA